MRALFLFLACLGSLSLCHPVLGVYCNDSSTNYPKATAEAKGQSRWSVGEILETNTPCGTSSHKTEQFECKLSAGGGNSSAALEWEQVTPCGIKQCGEGDPGYPTGKAVTGTPKKMVDGEQLMSTVKCSSGNEETYLCDTSGGPKWVKETCPAPPPVQKCKQTDTGFPTADNKDPAGKEYPDGTTVQGEKCADGSHAEYRCDASGTSPAWSELQACPPPPKPTTAKPAPAPGPAPEPKKPAGPGDSKKKEEPKKKKGGNAGVIVAVIIIIIIAAAVGVFLYLRRRKQKAALAEAGEPGAADGKSAKSDRSALQETQKSNRGGSQREKSARESSAREEEVASSKEATQKEESINME